MWAVTWCFSLATCALAFAKNFFASSNRECAPFSHSFQPETNGRCLFSSLPFGETALWIRKVGTGNKLAKRRESVRGERACVNMRLLPAHQFRQQTPRSRRHAQTQHIMPCRQKRILQLWRSPDDWQAVPSHRTPAKPSFPRLGSVRLQKIRLGRSSQLPNSLFRNRFVKPGKLHH